MTYFAPPAVRRRRWATTESPEGQLRGQVLAHLLARGLTVFRANAAAFRGRVNTAQGLPDLFGILPDGRWWAIELKAPNARPRRDQAKQAATLEHLRANQAFVIVARSVLEVRAAFDDLQTTATTVTRTRP